MLLSHISVLIGTKIRGRVARLVSGLPQEAKPEEYTWDCNRRTFAGRLVMARIDLRMVVELLGHTTLQMVMHFAYISSEHQVSAFERLVKAGKRRDTNRTPALQGHLKQSAPLAK